MVQVIFRNVFEDATISINIKKFCNVPLSEEERELAYQILGCYVTKPFLENCIIQQEKIVKGETCYERSKRERRCKESAVVIEHVPICGTSGR